ncbi:zn(2)-c6 fungal-type DNA-binding domain protein [Fusarium flagelliforme]|uniref:Zn(2)-c6 fungal-type DNA-binding domain protein n=1 Tax=Fusarium flagelliforme TaxID=2675880 RepID=A0A395MMC9_9HYPO|nr:zn(2)-c6 fungal-type DNA-binding domain protein [Fusarium flagelliforme]
MAAISTPGFKSSDIIFDIPYHASILIEPLLANIRISKWTTVTCDESMLTSLLEHYFQHAYHYFTFFHKDLFLRDLKSGSAQHCSSLLVNAVLASATQYLPEIQGRNEPWDTESLCYRFFAETKRLWELEMGENQIGNVYMVQAAKIAYNLDFFGANGRGEMDIAKQFTAWCLFSWQSLMLFHFYKPPLFEKPPCIDLPDPHASSWFYPEIHVRYPESGSRPIFFPETFMQTVKFRIILNDLANDRFGGGKNMAVTLEQAAKYYRRLCQWFEDLPACLKPDKIVLPSHLNLHIHFQYIVMLLLEPFVASEKDNPSITLLDGMTKPIRAIVHEATIRFETLIRAYYLRHSFSTYAPVMVQFLSVLGFLSAQKAAINPADHQSSMILATLGLENQAQQAYLANAMFKLLFSKIPPGMADVTSQYCSLNVAGAVVEIQPAYVRSAYPIHMVSINADAEEQRLDRLIEELKI